MTDPMIGRVIGNYRIEGPIREGGMGAVYTAVHAQIGHTIAVKVIGLGRETTEKDQARFLAEAKTTGRLSHTNIVRIIDFLVQDGIYYMLMEYIHGHSLDQVLAKQEGPLPLSKAASLLAFAARALDYAHNQGVVHRDVKPANILIAEEDGRVVLTDFGIAKLSQAPTMDLTRDGATVGTPAYMSPEQASGKEVDARSDVYSLAVVLYEMAAGRTPFVGGTMEVLSQHVSSPPPSPREFNPNLTRRQETVILKGLEKDPDNRYGRAGDLASAFLATITGTAEVAIETGSRWERIREGRAWGAIMRVGRFARGLSLGLVGLLARAALSIVVGGVVVSLAIVLGLSILAGRGLERLIAETDWRLNEVGPGFAASLTYEAAAAGIEALAAQALPGTLDNVQLYPRSPTSLLILGDVQGQTVSLDLTVEVVDGRPLFAISRFDRIPVPIVGAIIARGANQGLDEALTASGASVTSIEIAETGIRLTMEGSGTQTAAAGSGRCRDGEAFADDFDDIFSGWAQHYDAEDAEVGYWEGGYLLRTRASEIIINQALPCRFGAFDASVEASPAGDPGDAAWGLIFLEVDPDNYWVFQINRLGWYSVERVEGGRFSLVIPWTQSEAIRVRGANTLEVLVEGGRGEVFANYQSVAEFSVTGSSASTTGSLGLQLRSASQPEVGVLFDNLTVRLP